MQQTESLPVYVHTWCTQSCCCCCCRLKKNNRNHVTKLSKLPSTSRGQCWGNFFIRSSKPRQRSFLCERSHSARASIKISKSCRHALPRLSISLKPHPFRSQSRTGSLNRKETSSQQLARRWSKCLTSIGLKDVCVLARRCNTTLGQLGLFYDTPPLVTQGVAGRLRLVGLGWETMREFELQDNPG